MEYRYGEFSGEQMVFAKSNMRKQIFFLLLIVDPTTASEYQDMSVEAAFENVLSTFGGLNALLGYPKEFVKVMALINAAFLEYQSEQFSWEKYRKLILKAGCEVLKIKEE